MELRNLAVLVEVVRQNGFTRAADALGSTQSTVSKSVKALEEELGTPLFDRRGRRFALTEAGEAVFRHGSRLLGAREDMLAEIAELRGLDRGTLRLGLPRMGGDALFAPIFARFRQLHPAIEVQLREDGSARLRELLHAGELDLAGLVLPEAPEFETEELGRDPILAVLPREHPLAGRRRLEFADLADQPLVLFDTSFRLHDIIVDAFRSRGVSPRVVMRTSQLDVMLELVSTGMGICFLPRLIVRARAGARARARARARAGVRAVPIGAPALEWRMALAWRRNGYLSAAARAWLALARTGGR